MAGETHRPGIPATKAPGLSQKVFNCPSCGGGIILRALGQSVSVACRSCGSVIDATNDNYQIISKASEQLTIEPLIPLGRRGKLHGVLWEVIGFMVRCDGPGIYCWREYLLFNPMRGFRWLMEFDGHWNYIVMIKETPTTDIARKGREAGIYMGKTYFLFHKGIAKVSYVMGEFYWRVKVNEEVEVEDYILPPEILSSETSGAEVTWSMGEYLEPDSVRLAFQVITPMPVPIGIAPNQPSPVSLHSPKIVKNWKAFIVIVLLFQMLNIIRFKNERAYSQSFVFQPQDVAKTQVSPPFELKYGTTNVEFTLHSPVQNTWVEVQIDLINDSNGKTIEFEKGIEFYSGRDFDGSWSEGHQTASILLSSVPAGTYHLNVEIAGPASPQSTPIHVLVKRDVLTWSNFFWTIILISVYPLIVWWRSRSFELGRWVQSDFSAYHHHQEGE